MFTGIIESLGKVTNVKVDRGNIDFTIESEISNELKIDQSVSHNGVCLTVTETTNNTHTVTAVKETLEKLVGFIARQQSLYFQKGNNFLRPLLQKEVASHLDLTPSSVSRIL